MSEKIVSSIARPSGAALFWASFKYIVRENKALLTDFFSRLKFWQHQTAYFNLPQSQYTVQFIGRGKDLGTLKALLGAADAENIEQPSFELLKISELPKTDALKVPLSLNTVVSLDKSLEEIVATYAKSLRRALKKQVAEFDYQIVNDTEQVRQMDKTMLRPYAIARNGESASQIPEADVLSMALGDFGAMYQLTASGSPVGCHLGNAFVSGGKRYWHVNRFGYIESVFSDYKRLQEANSANLHLALVTAIENGYDYCDYGFSLARPGDGLLEWKRRRKGLLKHYISGRCVYVVPPKENKNQFYWENPMFAIEGNHITLHLGVPDNMEVEAVLGRYKEMGYDGLNKVYLYSNGQLPKEVASGIGKLYEGLRIQPKIITKVV